MLYYKFEQERELSSYPKEYTFWEAILRSNVVTYGAVVYHMPRLESFMYNYVHKTPDKIVIVHYKTENYPSIAILEYTGELFVYTLRCYKQEKEAYYITEYGGIVYQRQLKVGNMVQCVYNLRTLENRDITVFRVQLGKEE